MSIDDPSGRHEGARGYALLKVAKDVPKLSPASPLEASQLSWLGGTADSRITLCFLQSATDEPGPFNIRGYA